MTRLVNFLLDQVGWFCCALGSAWHLPWLGVSIAMCRIVNAFTDRKVGSQANADRMAFVSRQTIEKVREACPDAEWRLGAVRRLVGTLRVIGASRVGRRPGKQTPDRYQSEDPEAGQSIQGHSVVCRGRIGPN